MSHARELDFNILLQPHISKTNKYLLDNYQISVSLHNGLRNFIAMPFMGSYVRSAPNGSDHSKVEFSKRKPESSTRRFLVVGMPSHIQYLRDAADKVIYQDLNDEELWTAEGL